MDKQNRSVTIGNVHIDMIIKQLSSTEQKIGAWKIISFLVNVSGKVRKSELTKLANQISYEVSKKGKASELKYEL
jgi:hypothetical protein